MTSGGAGFVPVSERDREGQQYRTEEDCTAPKSTVNLL